MGRIVIQASKPWEIDYALRFDGFRVVGYRAIAAEQGARFEEQLVERAAVCMWRLRRLYGIEAGIFHFEIATIERHNASKKLARSSL